MSMEDALKIVQLEQDVRDMRFAALSARKLLAGALCAVCGDPLGEDQPVQNDEEMTMHQRCLGDLP